MPYRDANAERLAARERQRRYRERQRAAKARAPVLALPGAPPADPVGELAASACVSPSLETFSHSVCTRNASARTATSRPPASSGRSSAPRAPSRISMSVFVICSRARLAVAASVIVISPVPYRRKGRERFLTDEELLRLSATLSAHADRWPHQAAVIRLLLLTGCRKGEILTLRWSDYREGHLFLRDSKTGPRTVWLSEPARKVLDAMERTSHWVFPASKGNRLAETTYGSSDCIPANKRTINRSPSSTRSGSVSLCSFIPRTIFRGTPIPMCSR